jgi:succinate dehydrogenase/fumarate reductase cytochrome b subunit
MILYIILAIFLNSLLGAVVLSSLDTKDKRYYKWYDSCPLPGIGHFIILSLWPIMAYFMQKEKNKAKV